MSDARTCSICSNSSHRLKDKAANAFSRVQYIEQPTARDLAADRGNTMFEAAKLRPVVIDESLTGLDTLLLAREMGYTGVALKACKGQSQTLLLAAAAQKYKMFRCVQDLTCPGAALVHSAGIAAHVPGVSALEANAREYVPAASVGWEKRYPGIFDVRDGYLDTAGLSGPGLGTKSAVVWPMSANSQYGSCVLILALTLRNSSGQLSPSAMWATGAPSRFQAQSNLDLSCGRRSREQARYLSAPGTGRTRSDSDLHPWRRVVIGP